MIGRLAVFALAFVASSPAYASYFFVPPDEPIPIEDGIPTHPCGSGAGHTIFLNRDGGEYVPGRPDDSRENRSGILSAPANVPGFPYGMEAWDLVVDCVDDLFADFDVRVTDEDPGDEPHLEVVVGGHPHNIGLPDNVGGIALFGCRLIENAIVFDFAGHIGDDPRAICETAAHELGHAIGLDHARLCEEVMSYLRDCGERGFVDADAECGEFETRPCACGRETQNSYQYLLDTLGPRPPDELPTVVITSPIEGDVVYPGFPVEFTATDDGVVDRTVLVLDGDPVEVDFEEPWGFVAPADIAPGPLVVEVRAYDDEEQRGFDSVSVTVGGEDGEDAGPSHDGSPDEDGGPEQVRYGGCGCRAASGPDLGGPLAVALLPGTVLVSRPRARARARARSSSSSSQPVTRT